MVDVVPLAKARPVSDSGENGRLGALRQRCEGLSGAALLEVMIRDEFSGRLAVISSFGAESAVLLHMVAEVDPATPVIFLNTGKLFPETLRYRDRLQAKLGLAEIRVMGPHPDDEHSLDSDGGLWNSNPDACCHFRKVLPQARALAGFEAVVTGRKRFQTGARMTMPLIEEETVAVLPGLPKPVVDHRIKINPLALWGEEELQHYQETHRLPAHPLVKDGYLSIGCMPCTDRVSEGGDYREGRWAGRDKDECGIHLPAFRDGDGI
ncbi:MAG: phosphoadenylyl-sulfate reductase [Parvularculales bacterium]